MKCVESSGYITIKDKYSIEYYICKLTQYHYEDDTFSFIFEPFWSIIDLVIDKPEIYQGIPGLNMDKHKDKYVREKMLPVYIAERVPPKNRVNLIEVLKEANLTYYDPMAYLLGTKYQYFGDNFYMTKVNEKKIVTINDDTSKRKNIISVIKDVLNNLAHNNDVIFYNSLIDDTNRNTVFRILYSIYIKEHKRRVAKQNDGIKNAKKENKYTGRKPIAIDNIKFYEILNKVNKKQMSAKEAAKTLGISIDKYYRHKKKLELNKP